MNNVGKATFAILMAVFGLSSWATDYTWTGNGQESNWADRNNYDPVPAEGVLPGSGDTIIVPADMTATLFASDTASWTVVNGIQRLRPAADGVINIVVNPEDGDGGEATLACQITYKGAASYLQGHVVKKGKGSLVLTNVGQHAYYSYFDIEEGALVGPQAITDIYAASEFDTVTIAEGAVFYTPSSASGSSPTYSFRGISGLGMVTNNSAGSAKKLILGSSTTFDGPIGGNISVDAKYAFQPNNLSNTFTGGVTSDGANVKVLAFGMADQPSPLGTAANMTIAAGGFGFVYLGEGETTDKNLLLSTGVGELVFDAGATGGLNLAGEIKPSGKVNPSLVLTGDGCKTNVISGAICVSSSGASYSITNLVKRGTGTWRIADNANDTWSGMLKVETGTLQFDSLAPLGVVCSLGTAAAADPYSIWLKGGTLEYTGTDDADGLRRTVGVSADATILNSGDAELTLGNVSAAADDVTLTLGGGDMTLSGATGDLSVRKTGAGTVRLIGDQTFEGELAVTEGTAIVDLPKYEWYRVAFRHTISNQTMFYVNEFGLYDADGKRQNANLAFVNPLALADVPKLSPGQVCLEPKRGTSDAKDVANLFDDKEAAWHDYIKKPNGTGSIDPQPDNPDSWVWVTMRLPKGAVPVTSFDAVIGGTYVSNAKTRSVHDFLLRGSVDGVNWDDLCETNKLYRQLGVNYQWFFKEVEYKPGDAAEHATGCPIAARPAQLPAQLNNCTVNVSKDAALKAGAEGMTISKLRLDAAGVGTIEGFSLADEGTIDFANVAKGTRSLTFTIPGMDAAEVDKIADWTFTVNNETPKNWSVSVRNGVVTLQKNGLILLVR